MRLHFDEGQHQLQQQHDRQESVGRCLSIILLVLFGIFTLYLGLEIFLKEQPIRSLYEFTDKSTIYLKDFLILFYSTLFDETESSNHSQKLSNCLLNLRFSLQVKQFQPVSRELDLGPVSARIHVGEQLDIAHCYLRH